MPRDLRRSRDAHRAPILVAAIATLTIAACGGDSKEETAENTICDARADIAEQIDTLKALTPQTVEVATVSAALGQIREDLERIRSARADLAEDRRAEVQAANDAFATAVQSAITAAASSLASSDAKQQLEEARDDLVAGYEETFAKIDC